MVYVCSWKNIKSRRDDNEYVYVWSRSFLVRLFFWNSIPIMLIFVGWTTMGLLQGYFLEHVVLRLIFTYSI